MDIGFNLNINPCSIPYVIGFVCVMVMVVVFFVCAKGILTKVFNGEKKEIKEDKQEILLLESSDKNGRKGK